MKIAFHALPTDVVSDIRATGHDAYGLPVERHVSDGEVYPCRHCLGVIPQGFEYLILAHRPFTQSHAYAETGPIFLCADPCERAAENGEVPDILRSNSYILRGYDQSERIIYGTGQVTATSEIPGYAQSLLGDDTVAFVDVRSAANNCFQCRIKRT